MNRIAVICARGASKGLAGKNIRPLGGRPLIAHTIVQAREAGLFTCVAVSSDSHQILDIARHWGADQVIERPAELAADTAPKIPAIRHCVEAVEARTGTPFDTICDLAVTSPLRAVADVRGAVALLEGGDAGSVLSATPSRHSPYFSIVELDAAGKTHLCKRRDGPVVRRQDAPLCFDLNGAVYVWTRAALFDERLSVVGDGSALYEMPEERALDIDTEMDFRFAELVMTEAGARA